MFFYCLPNPGFESLLKAEAAAHAPDLHPSYSRPGFVTFKASEPRPAPRFTFARIVGQFLGKGSRAQAEATVVAETGRIVHRFSLAEGRGSGPEAAPGQEVLDVVAVGPDEFWWGFRTVGPWDWGWAGGMPSFELPQEAPSRAWLKLEEMLTWSRWTPSPQAVILELGSAPGGATWALLNRGATVVGVDVAPMATVCLEHPRFSHRAVSIRDLRKRDLPEKIDALFCDLGLKPVEAVPQIRHFCQIIPSIRRVYYTLKMGDGQTTADLDRWRDALRALGFTVKSTHLPSNRREILVVGVRIDSSSSSDSL